MPLTNLKHCIKSPLIRHSKRKKIFFFLGSNELFGLIGARTENGYETWSEKKSRKGKVSKEKFFNRDVVNKNYI